MHGSKIKLFLMARHISITGTKLPFQKAVSGVKFVSSFLLPPPLAFSPSSSDLGSSGLTPDRNSHRLLFPVDTVILALNRGREEGGYNIRYHGHSTSSCWISHPVMLSETSAHCSKGERQRQSQSISFEWARSLPSSPLLWPFKFRWHGALATGERESEHEDWKCRDTVDILFCEVKFSEL